MTADIDVLPGEVPDADNMVAIEELAERISGTEFREWYREREYADNVREGHPYFNGPSPVPEPERHSPSRLLRCHRKVYYKLHNAPAESSDPDGIFWFGSHVETDVIEPFLDAIVGEDQYVRNSIWVDFEVSAATGTLHVRGTTDPVIVDGTSTPLLPTEVKTTASVDSLDGPREHHRAQAHAYLYGLSDEAESQVRQIMLIYADRENFDMKVFCVTFDPEFWVETVIDWASTNTDYRRAEELPAPSPEFDWECRYCDFRKRCGQTDDPFENEEPAGLLPLTKYPRDALQEYFEAHPQAKLTPTVAHQYPDLVSRYGTYPWVCRACSTAYPVGAVEWDGNPDNPPVCPSCSTDTPGTLAGPKPDSQLAWPITPGRGDEDDG